MPSKHINSPLDHLLTLIEEEEELKVFFSNPHPEKDASLSEVYSVCLYDAEKNFRGVEAVTPLLVAVYLNYPGHTLICLEKFIDNWRNSLKNNDIDDVVFYCRQAQEIMQLTNIAHHSNDMKSQINSAFKDILSASLPYYPHPVENDETTVAYEELNLAELIAKNYPLLDKFFSEPANANNLNHLPLNYFFQYSTQNDGLQEYHATTLNIIILAVRLKKPEHLLLILQTHKSLIDEPLIPQMAHYFQHQNQDPEIGRILYQFMPFKTPNPTDTAATSKIIFFKEGGTPDTKEEISYQELSNKTGKQL